MSEQASQDPRIDNDAWAEICRLANIPTVDNPFAGQSDGSTAMQQSSEYSGPFEDSGDIAQQRVGGESFGEAQEYDDDDDDDDTFGTVYLAEIIPRLRTQNRDYLDLVETVNRTQCHVLDFHSLSIKPTSSNAVTNAVQTDPSKWWDKSTKSHYYKHKDLPQAAWDVRDKVRRGQRLVAGLVRGLPRDEEDAWYLSGCDGSLHQYSAEAEASATTCTRGTQLPSDRSFICVHQLDMAMSVPNQACKLYGGEKIE